MDYNLLLIHYLIYSYIVDITPEEKRTLRLAVVSGIIALAVPISQFIRVPIYNNGGYLAIWLTALGLYALAFIYVIFFLEDSRGREKQTEPRVFRPIREPGHMSGSPFEEAFDCMAIKRNLWQCFTITFQPRQGYKRVIIALLLACLSLNLFSIGWYIILMLISLKTIFNSIVLVS